MSFSVKGKTIGATVLEVVKTLSAELKAKGIPLLSSHFVSGNDVMVTCPWHNNGMEKKPSCGISMRGKSEGMAHCFTCGTVATLPEFVSKCFGRDDGGRYGTEWLLQRFVSFEADGVRKLEPLPTKQMGNGCIINGVEPKFADYHPYMEQRKLTPWVRREFHVGYDQQTDSLTFPVWDERGRFVGVTRRACHGKAFNIPKGMEKPVYALNKVTSATVFVCESVINCLTLWGWGYQAIALFGLGAQRQYDILKKRAIRHYVLCFDGDDAGRRGRERFKDQLKNALVSWVELPQGKDVNDLTLEEFQALPHWMAK